MTQLTLAKAQAIIAGALAHSRAQNYAPMGVAVLDARGVLKAFGIEDGSALRRADIAIGKAYGALSMGVGSRTLGVRAAERRHFISPGKGPIAGVCVSLAGRGLLFRVR